MKEWRRRGLSSSRTREEEENRNRWRRGLSSHGTYQLVEDMVSHTAYSVSTCLSSRNIQKSRYTPLIYHSLPSQFISFFTHLRPLEHMTFQCDSVSDPDAADDGSAIIATIFVLLGLWSDHDY